MAQADDRMVTVSEAVDAFVQHEVAALRAAGHQVWARRYPEGDGGTEGRHSWSYILAVGDQPAFCFEPVYRGRLTDLVPAGFDDFTLFVGGGKVEEFPSDLAAAAGRAGLGVPQELAATAPDGTSLRFVTRIDSPESAREWFSRPEAYLRCGECGFLPDTGFVRVGDPGDECDCQGFSRDENGALEWREDSRHLFPAVYLPS